MMPQRVPVNTFFASGNKGRSIHGSIYLDDNETSSLMASNLKFELIGTSVSKHQDSAPQCKERTTQIYRRTITDSRRKAPGNCSKETNTSNMNIVSDLAIALNASTAKVTETSKPTSPAHINDTPARIYESLREPGSAATVHTLMGPSFRGLDRLGHHAPHEGRRSN